MTRLLVCLLVGSALLACGTAPVEREKFSRTHIERPYTPPTEVQQFSNAVRYDKTSTQSDFSISPLHSEVPVTDWFSASFLLVIPIDLKFQFFHDNNHWLGASLGLAGIVSSGGDFQIDPVLGVAHQIPLSQSVAIVHRAYGAVQRSIASLTKRSYEARYTVGSLIQLSPYWAVLPHLAVLVTEYQSGTQPITFAHRASFPMGVNTAISLADEWELSFRYTLRRMGEVSGYTQHRLTAEITYLWTNKAKDAETD